MGNLHEMDWWEFPFRGWNKYVFAEVGKKRKLLHAFMRQQTVESEVAALEHISVDRRPLGKNDVFRLLAHRFERQRITPDDVALKDEFDRFPALIFGFAFEQAAVVVNEDVEKALSTRADVILQDINAVDGGDGKYGVTFIFQLRAGIALFHDAKFAFQDFRQEIAVSAGGLQESGVDAFRL